MVRGKPTRWPADGATGVPASARVADLGAPVAALFAQAGLAADAVVGTPLTLHFWRALDAKDAAEVSCRAFAGNLAVDGVFLALGGERGGPDGCFVFVPKAPWPAGATVEVRWSVPTSVLAKGENQPTATFTVP
jgi:hypothetical protein